MPKNKYNIGDMLETVNGEVLVVREIHVHLTEETCLYSGYVGPTWGDTGWHQGILESDLKPYKKKVRKYQWAVQTYDSCGYTLTKLLLTEEEAKGIFRRSKIKKIESVFIDVEE